MHWNIGWSIGTLYVSSYVHLTSAVSKHLHLEFFWQSHEKLFELSTKKTSWPLWQTWAQVSHKFIFSLVPQVRHWYTFWSIHLSPDAKKVHIGSIFGMSLLFAGGGGLSLSGIKFRCSNSSIIWSSDTFLTGSSMTLWQKGQSCSFFKHTSHIVCPHPGIIIGALDDGIIAR